MKIISDLSGILDAVSERELSNLVSYVRGYYYGVNGEELSRDMTVLFFESNYSTFIWDTALRGSLDEANYNSIKRLERSSEEGSDGVGRHLGNYVVKTILKGRDE